MERAAEPDPLARAAEHLDAGRTALALEFLLPVLDQRAARGDRECALAAAALRIGAAQAPVPRAPDALAGAFDRLVALVRRQQEQIRTLRELVEDTL